VLTLERYGGVELAVQLALALGMFVDFGLGPIGARRVASAPREAARVAAEIATLRLALAALAFAAALTIGAMLDVSADVRALVRLVALSLFAAPFVASWLFQGLGQMGWVAGGQLLRMCVFAVLVFALVDGDAQLARVGAAELCAMFAMAAWYALGQLRSVGSLRLGAPWPRLRQLAVDSLPVGLSRGLAALQQ
jgi:O-antigen/teichoic acid export membrane protein